MRRRLFALLVATLVVAGGAGMAVAKTPAELRAHGPTDVTGTEATAVFGVAARTIRQVRYHDKQTLVYDFLLSNEGSLPVRVEGMTPLERAPRLFRYLSLEDRHGQDRFVVGAGESTPVRLSMRMEACESLSARAGSFATEVNLAVSRAGFLDDVVGVQLPEEIHTGSPREAFCPESTAQSRPPG